MKIIYFLLNDNLYSRFRFGIVNLLNTFKIKNVSCVVGIISLKCIAIEFAIPSILIFKNRIENMVLIKKYNFLSVFFF